MGLLAPNRRAAIAAAARLNKRLTPRQRELRRYGARKVRTFYDDGWGVWLFKRYRDGRGWVLFGLVEVKKWR